MTSGISSLCLVTIPCQFDYVWGKLSKKQTRKMTCRAHQIRHSISVKFLIRNNFNNFNNFRTQTHHIKDAVEYQVKVRIYQ